MIEIKEVKGRRAMNVFASYPVKLYKGCPYYVPSLRSDEKATFNKKKNYNLVNNECKAFLCYKDGKVVGRIAGLINKKENQLTGQKMVRFSRFECIDDIKVFKALLGAVEDFGKQNGMDTIHGPWGFNDTDREGMLTFGFDKRSTYSTNYYYPYFCERMKELGFEDESKWQEREFVLPKEPLERIDKLSEKIKEKAGVVDVAKTMSISQIAKRYGVKLFNTLNEAYAHLDGYVPIEGKAVDNVIKQFATIANRRYVSVMVDKNDEVAAFGIALPSICKPLIKHRGKLFPFAFVGVLKSILKPKELELGLIGTKKEYKNYGLNAIIISNILKNIIEDKIERVETNPMLDTNLNIQQQWKIVETNVIKRRQTYKKQIGSLIK